jgi:hypothetical protein
MAPLITTAKVIVFWCGGWVCVLGVGGIYRVCSALPCARVGPLSGRAAGEGGPFVAQPAHRVGGVKRCPAAGRLGQGQLPHKAAGLPAVYFLIQVGQYPGFGFCGCN